MILIPETMCPVHRGFIAMSGRLAHIRSKFGGSYLDLERWEPPKCIFFKNFAENYHLFLHTMEEKEREMNRKEREKAASSAKVSPTQRHPLPPYLYFQNLCHLMFGILALTADQILRLIPPLSC